MNNPRSYFTIQTILRIGLSAYKEVGLGSGPNST